MHSMTTAARGCRHPSRPGLIEVFETREMHRVETVRTESGAHTLGFDPSRHSVYAFLPNTHRALIYTDRG